MFSHRPFRAIILVYVYYTVLGKKMETDNGATQTKRGLGLVLRALKYRNYRLFFFGQSVSLIGTWMQMAAVSWLVYRITGSVFYLGLVSFCDSFPVF